VRKATPPELQPLSLMKFAQTLEEDSKLPDERARQVMVIAKNEESVIKTTA
jgi:hypothetical protein